MEQKRIQAELETSLAKYVAFHTVPMDIPACTQAIHEMAQELKEIGMHVHTDGPIHPWLIATTTKSAMETKRVKVLFVVHIDIVPLDHEDQLILRATKDRLYGRGVYDMKFAAVTAKRMLAELASRGVLDQYDVGFLLTSDEEKGGYHGAVEFLEQGWLCDIAIVPDGGWNWSLEARTKGIQYLYLTALGRAAHSSRPWLGDNPISRLAPAIDEITRHFKNDDPSKTVVSINTVKASNSTVHNTTQIAAWATAGLSIRAFTNEEAETAMSYIKETCDKYRIDVDITLNDAPFRLMKDNALVKVFMQTLEEVHGKPLTFSDALAASDARHFAPYGIPTVLVYPDGGDHHGPEEWIVRDDLYRYYLLCKNYVQKVAKISTNEPN